MNVNVNATAPWLDGIALADQIARRDRTPAEVLDEAIGRAEKVNPTLNALSEALFDQARAAAAQIVPGAAPLAGVPTLVKDLFAPLAGARMTNGSLTCREAVAPHDAEVVARLKRAGTVIFGTTTSPEFGSSYTTESRLFGATRNPWNPERSAGGSSGGAAAMVAARVVPFAHGNDGGGSLRVPASACGVFGLKPTRGRVPMGPDVGEGWAGMGTNHVISVSVRDSALALDMLAGADAGAPYAAPHDEARFLSALAERPQGLRIGLVTALAPWDSDPLCIAAARDAAALCEDLGHPVEETALPVDAPALLDSIFTIIGAQTRHLVDTIARQSGHRVDETQLDPVQVLILRDKGGVSGAEYAGAVDAIHALGRRMAALFQDYDLLLMPTTAKPAPPIGALRVETGASLAQYIELSHSYSPFTAIFNASGQPAMSVPLFWTPDGLPIGAHFAAPFGAERRLFALAAQLEEARPWAGRLPPVCAL